MFYSTHNISFGWEIRKRIFDYALLIRVLLDNFLKFHIEFVLEDLHFPGKSKHLFYF